MKFIAVDDCDNVEVIQLDPSSVIKAEEVFMPCGECGFAVLQSSDHVHISKEPEKEESDSLRFEGFISNHIDFYSIIREHPNHDLRVITDQFGITIKLIKKGGE